MRTEEREPSKLEEPDVEAHYHKSRGAKDEGFEEPEDKAKDEPPDVEAHVHKSRG